MTTERRPHATWDGAWRPDPRSVEAFSRLRPGQLATVVKLAPDGTEAARYPAKVAETSAPAPWLELVAEWTLPRVVVAELAFEPGDTLHEYFSAEHPYNAFAVFAPDGELRGWYGNVTYPAFLYEVDGKRVLVWHDLYLDVVVLANGTTHLLDDDELAASGFPDREPLFAAAIIQARQGLIETIPTLVPDRRDALGARNH